MRSNVKSSLAKIPPEAVIFILVFILNLVLATPKLLPSYQEINPYDAAKHVGKGLRLVDGRELITK